jgi:hypothetical protein
VEEVIRRTASAHGIFADVHATLTNAHRGPAGGLLSIIDGVDARLAQATQLPAGPRAREVRASSKKLRDTVESGRTSRVASSSFNRSGAPLPPRRNPSWPVSHSSTKPRGLLQARSRRRQRGRGSS